MKKLLLSLTLLLVAFSLMGSIGFANTVTLYPTDDAKVDSGNPDTNYGSDTILYTNGTYNRVYMKWNLSSCGVINYSKILSADFYYYVNVASYCGKWLNITPSGYNWTEETITWNNQPAVTGIALSDFCVYGEFGTENSYNYTTHLKASLQSGFDTLTFYGATSWYPSFFSKEYSINPAYRPHLDITYNGTLTCNGTGGNATTLQEAHIPSYPSPYNDLKCSAKGTSSESVSYAWYWNISGSSVQIASGTSSVVANEWTIVNTLSSSWVLPNATYYCIVSDTGGSKVSNTATANQIYNLVSLSTPTDKSLNENQSQTLTFTSTGSQTTYAFVECDWMSPTGTHYYPNDTSRSYGCKPILPYSTLNQMSAYRLMDEIGTWNGKSCFLYSSNYADCRTEDLGVQGYTLNETFWYVASAPSVTNISITPVNPKMNETLTCSVRAVTNDNTSTIDQLWNYFIINGAVVTSSYQSSIANNTVTNFTFNIGGLVSVGDNVSCGAFGVKLSPYAESGIAYSSGAIVRSARVTNISTTPEPQNVGIQKMMFYQTEIPTCSLRVEWEAPSGATGMTKMGSGYCSPVTMNHADAILYNMSFSYNDSVVFTENGLYKYTIKVCNCDVDSPADFDNPSFCPQEYCAYPVNYPTKSYGMRWTVNSNYYLYDLNLYNFTPTVNLGSYQTLSLWFSKRTNVFKAVLHKPDGTTKEYVVTNLMASNFSSGMSNDGLSGYLLLYSGVGEALDQIGNYSVDYYAGYGWVTNASNCLAYNECQYTNSSLGNNFTVAIGSSGYIANVSVEPPSQYFEGSVNVSFDTSNATDESCVRMINPTGTDALFKKETSSSNVTSWTVPFSTGVGKPMNQQGKYTFSIVACKKNGVASCIDDSGTSCGITSGNCDYCMYSFGSEYGVNITQGAISGVTYKKQIAIDENQVIKFTVNPYTNSTWIRILSHIVGQDDVYINTTSPNTFSNWTVEVPYKNITQAICKEYTDHTSCGYGGITFEVGALINGVWVRRGSENGEWFSFDVNTSMLLSHENVGESGSGICEALHICGGLSGKTFDMILAIFGTFCIMALGLVIVSKFTESSQALGIVAIGSFILGIAIFTIIGWLPYWIILIILLLCAGIIVTMFRGTMTGGT